MATVSLRVDFAAPIPSAAQGNRLDLGGRAQHGMSYRSVWLLVDTLNRAAPRLS